MPPAQIKLPVLAIEATMLGAGWVRISWLMAVVQPLAAVPVTVYWNGANGLPVTTDWFCWATGIPASQVYVLAPLTVMVTGLPSHTVPVDDCMLSTGLDNTVTEDVAEVVQLALEATTV